MGRSVDEKSVIKIVAYECGEFVGLAKEIEKQIKALPSAEPESVEIGERLAKIADLVEGTIDHFDREDAMDLLYQIKGVLK